jgi:hypothetical protein
MIKLAPIIESVLKEGGKLFGSRASRITTDEMNLVFKEVSTKLSEYFLKIQLSKALKSKDSHGDIDIVVEPKPNLISRIDIILKDDLAYGSVKDYSKNGNIHSILYHSNVINKDVHIDFLVATGEDYDPQFEYLSFGDMSGILGVLARQLGYSYSIEGFFKVYIDKSGRHHKILITKNLREGLRIMGYDRVLSTYDGISNSDDIVKFISGSPYFDSKDYVGQTMNHSDRKRVRGGRPSADYIRNALIELNKHRENNDFEYFFKNLYPDKFKAVLEKQNEIENTVIPKSKYGGEWILQNFPTLKPGKIVGDIKKFWFDTYGPDIDNVPEEELLTKTTEYLNKNQVV